MATAAARPPSFGEEVAPRQPPRLWLPPDIASPSAMRTSLQKLAEGRRARRLTFFRNGDRFDRGLVYALSSEKVRTFEALLEDLTRIMVDLPMGVRFIFSGDGREKVSQLEQLCEGCVYVCSSTDHFVRLPYGRQDPPRPHWTLGRSTRGIPGTPTANSPLPSSALHHGFVRPKLITVIRNGVRPRKAVRVLLNHKTARSFEQVLDDVTRVVNLDSGAVRKVFTLTGKPVTSLADFFGPDDIFIAYGVEKYSHDDFDLDTEECKQLNGSIRVRREQRFSSGRPVSPISDVSSNLSFQSSHSISPKTPRKLHHVALPETVAHRYLVREMLGDGNFACVYHCVSRISGEEYALKIIDKDKCKGKEQMIANEVAILRRVQHPNVVRLVEEFDVGSELYLVMELVKGGDLFDAIAAVSKFSEREAGRLVGDLARGLSHLHALRVVHRDIKPENLLVGGGGVLKLADFGLATELPPDGALLSTVCGTPTYVAPEILAETGYGLQVDVWAMGVITYILLCGFPPFVSQSNNQDELFDQILGGRFEFMSPYWDGISASAQELIRGMLQVDVMQRLTAGQVLQHPWLQQRGHAAGWQPESWQVGLHFEERPRTSLETAGTLSTVSGTLPPSPLGPCEEVLTASPVSSRETTARHGCPALGIPTLDTGVST
ncbi:serine/threonine-protein kinase DCLK1-like isoform X2 [Haemaphysalis longicornis]